MKGFCPLASGSQGNCIYIGTGKTKLLIDAGISAKMLRERLSEIAVELSDIDAILLTHEHTDHVKGLGQLAGKMGIPLFANSETAKAVMSLFPERFKFKIFSTGESFEFGDVEIKPFSVQHDAQDPVAFTLRVGALKLGFCADLGYATTLVAHELQQCDYLYLEANHQPSMVHASSRPLIYKQRVLSRQGHLSNEESGALLSQIYHPHLKHVHLAHLSSQCNTPEVALKVVRKTMQTQGREVNLSIAYQDKISTPILF